MIVSIIDLLIVEQWRMDVHFAHGRNCLTFAKFCLFGAFSFIIVVLQVTVLFKGHISSFFNIALLCFYRLLFLLDRFQIIRSVCLEIQREGKEKNNASTTGDSGYENSLPVNDIELPSSTCISVKCSCGRIYNGQGGLKMHQCSCRVIKDLYGGLGVP